jgi:hypothetical protein
MIYNAKGVTYTAQELADLSGITLDKLYEMDADYFYGADKNPSTHITSWFMTLTNSSGNTFESELWINFKPAKSINYASMVTSYGQVGKSYQLRWTTYNGCTGFGGACTSAGPYSPTDPKAWKYQSVYDAERPYAVIECKAVELPDDGKNASTSGYFTIVGCDTDDPCGPARRLPRSPVQ